MPSLIAVRPVRAPAASPPSPFSSPAARARVISTSSSNARLKETRRLGATDTVDYRAHPERKDEVLRLTAGRGVDHVVEVDEGGTIDQSVAGTAVGGQLHMIGEVEPTGKRLTARRSGISVSDQSRIDERYSWVARRDVAFLPRTPHRRSS